MSDNDLAHSSSRVPMPPGMLIRELDLSDATVASTVHAVGLRAYAVEAELIDFDGIPALSESLQRMTSRPLRWLGAVTGEGAVAAFVAWQTDSGQHITHIDRVCVDPAWFRRGLASCLLDHLLAEVTASSEVRVSTGADNQPAVKLYERLGFSRGVDFEPVPGLRMAQFVLHG
ncbi:GNAT family N-acetyltransferase [Streptomyces sp. NBC_01142]|uniref:GNAT family N-acetyltransferase n=1 Tax=Streptomyces sp. NBC_01142 TaxID=2975865 RepID=UPI00224E57A9|nr:GNAT family N-acetyltransferase [Streptomyces sp. NBC_01142]MCX4825797.1 GNAT family N-acetyltransferase [Streptomyces sp. NBC_01142]